MYWGEIMYILSIIIPVYNGSKYIRDCINSLVNQVNFSDIEVIIVNDGSTDDTMQILKQISYPNIKIINQSNGGVSVARNSGLSIVTGKYVGFMDIDDTIENDMYKILLDNANKYNADISAIGYNMIKGKEIIHFWDTKSIKTYTDIDKFKAFLEPNEFSGYIWDKIYKFDVIKELKFSQNLTMCEDKDFLYNCIKNSKNIVFEDICKYNYNMSNISAMTSQFNPKKMDMLKVVDNINNDICKIYPTLENLANAERLRTLIFLYRWIHKDKNSFKLYKDYRKQIKHDLKKYLLSFGKSMLSKRELMEFYLIKLFPFMYRFIVSIYFK